MKPLKLIFIVIFTIWTSATFAQYPDKGVTSDQIKTKAKNLTLEYSKQLALTGVQIPLFREVVEEYIEKSERAIDELEGREELDILVELQARESLRMNDILTQPQYRLYKQLKWKLQPLKVIEKKLK